MNKELFSARFKQFQGEIKQRWGKLTDDDLTRAEGHWDKFVGLLEERYGYARAKAESELEDFLDELEGEMDSDSEKDM
jgi:uncharacterized protein YjbJ (UPF0337 family)